MVRDCLQASDTQCEIQGQFIRERFKLQIKLGTSSPNFSFSPCKVGDSQIAEHEEANEGQHNVGDHVGDDWHRGSKQSRVAKHVKC